jgi:hypothetical protein
VLTGDGITSEGLKQKVRLMKPKGRRELNHRESRNPGSVMRFIESKIQDFI